MLFESGSCIIGDVRTGRFFWSDSADKTRMDDGSSPLHVGLAGGPDAFRRAFQPAASRAIRRAGAGVSRAAAGRRATGDSRSSAVRQSHGKKRLRIGSEGQESFVPAALLLPLRSRARPR